MTLGISRRDTIACTQTLYIWIIMSLNLEGMIQQVFTKPNRLVITFPEWVFKIRNILNTFASWELSVLITAFPVKSYYYFCTCPPVPCMWHCVRPGWAIRITDHAASTLVCARPGLFCGAALWLTSCCSSYSRAHSNVHWAFPVVPGTEDSEKDDDRMSLLSWSLHSYGGRDS